MLTLKKKKKKSNALEEMTKEESILETTIRLFTYTSKAKNLTMCLTHDQFHIYLNFNWSKIYIKANARGSL